jgi:hypothetical protein
VHATPALLANFSSTANRVAVASESSQILFTPFTKHNLAENLVQIEIDIQPDQFNVFMRRQFLRRLEILLRQQYKTFKLKSPRVFLINTKAFLSKPSGKSTVVLEMVITDSNDMHNELDNEDDDELEDTNVDLATREIIKSDFIVRELRRKQKYLRFDLVNLSLTSINSVLKTLNLDNYNARLSAFVHQITNDTSNGGGGGLKLEDYFSLRVLGISQVTCLSAANDPSLAANVRFTCSGHGKCDVHSHKCVCNRYYMHNVYARYFNYENDLTDGNNCGKCLFLLLIVFFGIVQF